MDAKLLKLAGLTAGIIILGVFLFACAGQENEITAWEVYGVYDDVADEVLIFAREGPEIKLFALDPAEDSQMREIFTLQAERLPAFIPYMKYEDGQRVLYQFEQTRGNTTLAVNRIVANDGSPASENRYESEVVENVLADGKDFHPVIFPHQEMYFENDDGVWRLAISAEFQEQWVYDYTFDVETAAEIPTDSAVQAEGYHVEPVTEEISIWVHRENRLDCPRISDLFDLQKMRETVLATKEQVGRFFNVDELQIPVNLVTGPPNTQIHQYGVIDGGVRYDWTDSLARLPFYERHISHTPDHSLGYGVATAVHWMAMMREGAVRIPTHAVASYFEGGEEFAESRYAFEAHHVNHWIPVDSQEAYHQQLSPVSLLVEPLVFDYLLQDFEKEEVLKYLTSRRRQRHSLPDSIEEDRENWEADNDLTQEFFDMTQQEMLQAALSQPTASERKYMKEYPPDYTVRDLEVVLKRDTAPGHLFLHEENRELMTLVDHREHLVVIDIDSWNKETVLTRPDEFDRMAMPSWFPGGREILIVGTVNGTTNLYVYDRDEDDLHQLTDTPHDVGGPDVSPCGDYIAYRSEKTGYSEIFIMDIHNEKTQQITEEKGNMLWPVWSSSGDKIAFQDRNGHRLGVYDVTSDTTQWSDLEPHKLGDYRRPEWLSEQEVLVPVRLYGTPFKSFISVNLQTEDTRVWGGFEFTAQQMIPLETEDRKFLATTSLYDEDVRDIYRMTTLVKFLPVNSETE